MDSAGAVDSAEAVDSAAVAAVSAAVNRPRLMEHPRTEVADHRPPTGRLLAVAAVVSAAVVHPRRVTGHRAATAVAEADRHPATGHLLPQVMEHRLPQVTGRLLPQVTEHRLAVAVVVSEVAAVSEVVAVAVSEAAVASEAAVELLPVATGHLRLPATGHRRLPVTGHRRLPATGHLRQLAMAHPREVVADTPAAVEDRRRPTVRRLEAGKIKEIKASYCLMMTI